MGASSKCSSHHQPDKLDQHLRVCLKMLCTPKNPMVLLIMIPTKWLFHWGYTPFSDIPIWKKMFWFSKNCPRLTGLLPCGGSGHLIPTLLAVHQQTHLGSDIKTLAGTFKPLENYKLQLGNTIPHMIYIYT